MRDLRPAPGGGREKVMHALDVRQPVRPTARPLHAQQPLVRLRAIRQPYRQSLGRQQIARPVRPFHQHQPRGLRLFKADFAHVVRAAEAVQIEMMHGRAGRFIALQQREGRTGHLQGGIGRERPDEGAGKRRFPSAKVALEQDKVARPRVKRDQFGEAFQFGKR